MNTIIIYETKKGCTQKCAEEVHARIPSAELVKITQFSGDISTYDHVIVLSPIYIGQINKQIKKFLKTNEQYLLNTTLSIGLCGMYSEGFEETKTTQFSPSILQHARIELLGGAYDFKKLNFLQRMVIKKIAKVSVSVEDIDYDAIHRLV